MTESELLRKARAHRNLPPVTLRRAIRAGAGLSQADIAEAVEVTRETVSRWESGDRRPRGTRLVQYVELLRRLQEVDR